MDISCIKYYSFNMNQNKVIFIVLLVWLMIADVYSSHTRYDERSHDFPGHVYYTQHIFNQHKLPHPNSINEAHNPPLYYLIDSIILPNNLNSTRENHINAVRFLSVIYGSIFLFVIWKLINRISSNNILNLFILLFTLTTPKFIFAFTTYNSDALSLMFCSLLIFYSTEYYFEPTKKNKLLLLIFSTLGFYTKFTIAFLMASIASIALIIQFKNIKVREYFKNILQIFSLAIVFLSPYLFFHNYALTNKLFPKNFTEMLYPKFELINFINSIYSVTLRPIINFNLNEWKEPWIYPWAYLHGYENPSTKVFDYFGFTFVTSIIGEYTLIKPDKLVIWIIFFLHLLIILIALQFSKKTLLVKLSFMLILFVHLIHILTMGFFKIPVYPCTMDYRYICYLWVPWAIVYSSVKLGDNKFFIFLLAACVFLQFYTALTITGQ